MTIAEPIRVPQTKDKPMKPYRIAADGTVKIRWPSNLTQWVTARALVSLALDAVLTLDEAQSLTQPKGRMNPGLKTVLTLLTYCYSAGIYGSQEIERAIESDPTVRYLCAHNYPDVVALRRFRREHRDQIKHCLAHVFTQAWAAQLEAGEASYLNYGWFENDFTQQVQDAAEDRLTLAVVMDEMVSDQ